MRKVKYLMFACLLAAIIGCSESKNEQPDNQYMVDLLAQRHSIVNPLDMQYYYNSKRADVYDSLRKNTDPETLDYVYMSYWYFRETLNSGNTEKAIELTEPFLDKLYNQEIAVQEQEISFFERLLATSYIRLGEQENCLINHGSASCIIPIAPAGFHSIRTGSEKAIEILERMLAKIPDDLELKWLLNIAYQTLGEYPDNVPEQHLIPLESFQNSSDSFNSRFEDVAPNLGIDISGLAGGSIMEDFNNDGYLDVLVTSSGFKRSDQMRFFLNDGTGQFTDQTKQAGLTGLVGGLNCVQTDYNNDGNIDVFVLRGGWFGKWGKHPNSLLRNNGDGTFTDVTKEAGILSFNPTQTCVWADFNNDGWLDLFIGNETNVGGNSMQVNRREVHPSEFYLNNGDGTFQDVAKRTGLSQTKLIKGATAIDANGDGNMDLYLSIMGGANKLFINNGKMKFVDQAANFGVQEPFVSFPVGSFDYNNDGNEDLFISGYSTSNNTLSFENAYEFLGNTPTAALPKLFRNNGDGSFTDVTQETAMNRSIYGMGFNYGDLDNDGFLDIYFGTGDPNFESIIPNRMFRTDDDPLQPGEFRDVDAPGGAIRDSLMPLPFKGPDPTLFQLLGFVVQAGQRFATITDLKVGDGNQNAAVGTTIAMMEQGSRVMSAVHKRLHYAMRQEFKILSRVMSESLPQEYPYSVAGEESTIMREDFDDRVDVIPVSNPNAFSQAQRIVLAQTKLQLAGAAPELHNMHEVYRDMYEALGVTDVDRIMKSVPDEEPVPIDPAQENINSLEMLELKAFEGQNHQAHITAHLVFGSSPMVGSLPPVAMSLQKHVMEHVKIAAQEQAIVAYSQQRQQAQQQGMSMGPEEEMLQMEQLVAQYVAEGLQQVKQLSGQLSGAGQPDPLVKLKETELQLKAQAEQNDAQLDAQKLNLDAQALQARKDQFQQRLSSQESQTAARIQSAMDRELLKQRSQ